METENGLNVKRICEGLGIATATYYARRQRGWTEEEALLVPKLKAVYTFEGESVYKYLRRVGGSYNAFQYRMNLGWNFEDAIKAAEKVRPYKRRKKNENM